MAWTVKYCQPLGACLRASRVLTNSRRTLVASLHFASATSAAPRNELHDRRRCSDSQARPFAAAKQPLVKLSGQIGPHWFRMGSFNDRPRP